MKVEIKFQVELPDIVHSEEELEEFLRYIFRDNGIMDSENPFNQIRADCDPIFGTFEWSYNRVILKNILNKRP